MYMWRLCTWLSICPPRAVLWDSEWNFWCTLLIIPSHYFISLTQWHDHTRFGCSLGLQSSCLWSAGLFSIGFCGEWILGFLILTHTPSGLGGGLGLGAFPSLGSSQVSKSGLGNLFGSVFSGLQQSQPEYTGLSHVSRLARHWQKVSITQVICSRCPWGQQQAYLLPSGQPYGPVRGPGWNGSSAMRVLSVVGVRGLVTELGLSGVK